MSVRTSEELYKSLDDELAWRNTIAHGEYLPINLEEYLEVYSEILALMNLFRNQIDNAVLLKSYVADAFRSQQNPFENA